MPRYQLEGSKKVISINKDGKQIKRYSGPYINYLDDLSDLSNYLLNSVMACSVFNSVTIEIEAKLSDLVSFLDIFFAYNQEIHEINTRYFYKDPRLYELFDSLVEKSTADTNFFLSEESPGFDRMEYLQVRLTNEQKRTEAVRKKAERRIAVLAETQERLKELSYEKDREIKFILEERNAFCKRFKGTFLV